MGSSIERRRWLVPEVIQSSSMDCGPASLQCLLGGFGVELSYPRLREACQTDIDGTSIDVMEELAERMGFEMAQVVVPMEHLWTPGAELLPAIAVLQEPTGLLHFVVVWRRLGPLFQIMDPARGRHWVHRDELRARLYRHRQPVLAEDWREWAVSDEVIGPLRERILRLGITRTRAEHMLDQARSDASWRGLGALDATVRFSEALARGRSVAPELLDHVLALTLEDPAALPRPYWSVRPVDSEPQAPRVEMRGVVLLRTSGRRRTPPRGSRESITAPEPRSGAPLELALTEPRPRPLRQLVAFLREDGLWSPLFIALLLGLSTIGLLTEALLFRIVLDLANHLGLGRHRLLAAAALMIFLFAMLLLTIAKATGVRRMGRHLDARLRLAFLRKLPRLHDRYFSSRSTADMAHRSHMLHLIGGLPALGARVLEAGAMLMMVVGGIAWIAPGAGVSAAVVATLAFGLPLATQPLLLARDLKVRSFSGVLTTFLMDALRGIVPLRTHGAEQSLAREHRRVLAQWARSSIELQSASVAMSVIAKLVTFAAVIALVVSHASATSGGGTVLLLIYWALRIPGLGEQLAASLRQYPAQRNTLLRLFEPLGMPQERTPEASGPEPSASGAVGIRFEDVEVLASGTPILTGIELRIEPGEHVAVVGPSGAGKSSLIGVLLGWHKPHRGRVVIDGEPLADGTLWRLRGRTAWVDPAVQLWNGTLGDNLRYGASDLAVAGLGAAIERAELRDVLERLPEGLCTPLGEAGGAVSGGEGQRVRLGRALVRDDIGLALLDEPFRGLDREARRRLLARVREAWRGATVLCATHDISDTEGFDRVLVVVGGRVVEDGAPADLGRRPESVYRRLLEADGRVREAVWGSTSWTRLEVAGGRIRS